MFLRFLCTFTLTFSLHASTLNEFSAAASTDSSSEFTNSSNDYSDSFFSDVFLDIFSVTAKIAFQVPFENSIERISIANSENHLLNKHSLVKDRDKTRATSYLRKNGTVMLPYIRADLAYSALEGGIQSIDYSAELGFGPLGVYARQSHYRDYDLDESLRIDQLYGLFRLTYFKSFELDFGFGNYKIDGRNTNDDFAFTMPVIIHPTENFGIEFRPVWSQINGNDLRDHTLDVLYDWKYISIKAGYRWQKIANARLNGAHIGVVFHY